MLMDAMSPTCNLEGLASAQAIQVGRGVLVGGGLGEGVGEFVAVEEGEGVAVQAGGRRTGDAWDGGAPEEREHGAVAAAEIMTRIHEMIRRPSRWLPMLRASIAPPNGLEMSRPASAWSLS